MSEKSIEYITTSDNNFTPPFIDTRPVTDVKFNGHCLIKEIPDYGKEINVYFLHNRSMVKRF